jgi:hypothetical protein
MTVRPVRAAEAITSRMNSSRTTGSRLETGSSSTSQTAGLPAILWDDPRLRSASTAERAVSGLVSRPG